MTKANRPYEVTVKCGETLKYSFPMEKSLEKFGGWYYDVDCTSPYNMATTKDDCEPVYLYARWIANDDAVMLKIVNAKAKYEVFAIKAGESFTQPALEDNGGKTFVGWYTDPQFTTEFVFDEPIYDAGTVTIYARWEGDEPAPLATTTPAATETTGTGSSGGTVRLVQQKLNSLGERLKDDGKYGAATAAAVQRFQRHNDLTADGSVGYATWEKMF